MSADTPNGIREFTKNPVTIKAFQWNGRDDDTGMGRSVATSGNNNNVSMKCD